MPYYEFEATVELGQQRLNRAKNDREAIDRYMRAHYAEAVASREVPAFVFHCLVQFPSELAPSQRRDLQETINSALQKVVAELRNKIHAMFSVDRDG